MAIIQDFLEFTVDEIPVEKTFTIEGTDYKFLIQYNQYGDFYTCTIKTIDGVVLIVNRLTYLSPINDSVIKGLDIVSKIIPVNYDNPDTDVNINKENFSKITIMLAVE